MLKSPPLMSPWSPNLCFIFPCNLYLQLAFTKMQALKKLIRNNEKEKSYDHCLHHAESSSQKVVKT